MLDPDTDIVVRWVRTGELNTVRAGVLVSPKEFSVGARVFMPWRDEQWEATIVEIGADVSASSDDSDDDMPLQQLQGNIHNLH